MRRLAYLIVFSLIVMLVAVPYAGAQEYDYSDDQPYAEGSQYAGDDQYAGGDQYDDDAIEELPATGGVPIVALAVFALAAAAGGLAMLRRIT